MCVSCFGWELPSRVVEHAPGEGKEPTYIQNDDDDDDDDEEEEAVFRHPLLSAAHPHEGAALFYSVHSVLMFCFVVVHEQRSQTAME